MTSLVGCGATEPKVSEPTEPTSASSSGAKNATATVPDPTTAAPEAPPPKEPVHVIPNTCATTDPCVPDPEFVNRLCNGSYPDVALLLMSKSMPFTHAYLRGDVDGWNAEGGMSTRAKLRFDEEVLVLKKRSANHDGIQVSGTGGYQVMRWDGACYTLAEDEVTMRRPPAAKSSPVTWRFLGNRTKEALLDNATIKAAYDRRNRECHGAASGEVTAACEKADKDLAASVISAIRLGAVIPTPELLP